MSSECQPQSELRYARIACAGHLPERSRPESSAHPAELRMVEEVEELRAELQRYLLRQPSLLDEGDVPIVNAWSTHQPTPGVPESAQRWQREHGRCEPLGESHQPLHLP